MGFTGLHDHHSAAYYPLQAQNAAAHQTVSYAAPSVQTYAAPAAAPMTYVQQPTYTANAFETGAYQLPTAYSMVMQPQQYQTAAYAFDTNNDGRVTQAEMRAADTNNDGKLDAKEVKAAQKKKSS